MTMKDVIHLRIMALCANAVYVAYGLMLHAMPFIIGCTIAVSIHTYHIYRLKNENKSSSTKRGSLEKDAQGRFIRFFSRR